MTTVGQGVSPSHRRERHHVPRHRAELQPLPPRRTPKAVRVAKAFVLVGIAGTVVGSMVGTQAAGRVGLTDVTWQQPESTAVAEALIAEHDCWQGAAPSSQAGRTPGHVVLSPAPDEPAVYSADLVDEALAHVFERPRDGMTVYAFCR